VIGHDWGSMITQFAMNLRPASFARVVLSAVPHIGRFQLGTTAAQLRRSHYIFKFQIPFWPEWRLPRNNFEWVENVLWRKWSPTWNFTTADIKPAKDNLADPQRLKAALAYYRSALRMGLNPAQMRIAMAPVALPVRLIYGTADGAIGAEMFQRQESLFSGGFDLCEATGRGHFMQYEDPDWFARRCAEWLNAEDAGESGRLPRR
jgi:pimeloyl-ACP methyl ester carboxylesterase